MRPSVFVYVVEDAAFVLKMMAFALDCEGIPHKTFDGPDQALAAFKAEVTKPAVLITDYDMGRMMTGVDLIMACKAIEPNLRTVVASGTVTSEMVLKPGIKVDRFISKPYRPSQIIEAIIQLATDPMPDTVKIPFQAVRLDEKPIEAKPLQKGKPSS
jgi:FixJ family two-component response regulator